MDKKKARRKFFSPQIFTDQQNNYKATNFITQEEQSKIKRNLKRPETR